MSNIRYGLGPNSTKIRNESVQVRLQSVNVGAPSTVKFTEDERAVLEAAAAEHVPGGHLSVFLRGVAVAAAAAFHDQAHATVPLDMTVKRSVELAARSCSMLVGEFIRAVALDSIGYTQLTECLIAARAAVASKNVGGSK